MPKTTRRTFLRTSAAAAAATGWNFSYPSFAGAMVSAPSAQPIVRLETDPKRALIPVLSWDTEGGDRAGANLLRTPDIGLRAFTGTLWLDSTDLPANVQTTSRGTRYLIELGRGGKLGWEISTAKDSFQMTFSPQRGWTLPQGALEVYFPFDISVTPTTALPALWHIGGRFEGPMVISAPDFGQMLLSAAPRADLTGRLEGSDEPMRLVNLVLTLPPLSEGREVTLNFTPLILDPPRGLEDESMWRLSRRSWFNGFAPAASVGDPASAHHLNAIAGLLTSKDVDGPCTFALYFYADLALWTPEVAKGISVAQPVRQSIEFFLAKRTIQSGEVIGYTDRVNFLDSNPSILISAWDYVEATGDLTWLEKMIGQLEWVANFSAIRDHDGDGLIEAPQSGNAGTYILPNRSSNWLDAINFGHKDAYSNALIYRAWRLMADLEARLHREPQRTYYTRLADRLKAAYARQLLNPKTGWIGCWRSADGVLHDYASPAINGLAVAYGLIDPAEGSKILDRLWTKMDRAGFTRYDLGIPLTLEPILRQDYMPGGAGCPKREDGTDTFQHYQNGGIYAGFSSPFLMANYLAGDRERTDHALEAMLGRANKGGFQNGVHNQYPQGMDGATWDGAPCGAEGYLADNYFFLRAVLLREQSFRRRYYGPMLMT